MNIIDLTEHYQDTLNFDWEDIEYGMAFEDIYGDPYWFCSNKTMSTSIFTDINRNEVTLNKLALIRTPEWDNGVIQYAVA